MDLTKHQEEKILPLIEDLIQAKDLDITKDSIVELSGGAGVGKTYSILFIINYMRCILICYKIMHVVILHKLLVIEIY